MFIIDIKPQQSIQGDLGRRWPYIQVRVMALTVENLKKAMISNQKHVRFLCLFTME